MRMAQDTIIIDNNNANPSYLMGEPVYPNQSQQQAEMSNYNNNNYANQGYNHNGYNQNTGYSQNVGYNQNTGYNNQNGYNQNYGNGNILSGNAQQNLGYELADGLVRNPQ